MRLGLLAGTDVANQIGSTSPEENECSSSCQHKNRTKQSPGFVLRVNAEARIPEEASFAHKGRVLKQETASAGTASGQGPSTVRADPCLFHSYTKSCAKGQRCEYSHSIHADQVVVPEPKQRRGHARHRIKKRVTQYLAAHDLYEVQRDLQQEAKQDSYAKELIRKHLTAIADSTFVASSSSSTAFWL